MSIGPRVGLMTLGVKHMRFPRTLGLQLPDLVKSRGIVSRPIGQLTGYNKRNLTTTTNQPIKPAPLSIRTIITLIIIASTGSMSFYLTFQMFKFINDDQDPNHRKSIFLPLWAHINWIYCKQYSMDQWSYLNSTLLPQDTEQMLNKFSSRIRFKLFNLLDNNKIILNQQLLNTNCLTLHTNPLRYNFKILTPYISGLEFVTTKPSKEQSLNQKPPLGNYLISYKNHDIYCGWSLQVIDFNNVQTFLLNQPQLNFHNQVSFQFEGKYDVNDNSKSGYIKFEGSVDGNNTNITFTKVSLVLYHHDKLFQYQLM